MSNNILRFRWVFSDLWNYRFIKVVFELIGTIIKIFLRFSHQNSLIRKLLTWRLIFKFSRRMLITLKLRCKLTLYLFFKSHFRIGFKILLSYNWIVLLEKSNLRVILSFNVFKPLVWGFYRFDFLLASHSWWIIL